MLFFWQCILGIPDLIRSLKLRLNPEFNLGTTTPHHRINCDWGYIDFTLLTRRGSHKSRFFGCWRLSRRVATIKKHLSKGIGTYLTSEQSACGPNRAAEAQNHLRGLPRRRLVSIFVQTHLPNANPDRVLLTAVVLAARLNHLNKVTFHTDFVIDGLLAGENKRLTARPMSGIAEVGGCPPFPAPARDVA